MVLKKISIDNSVRYIPKSEQPKERDIKSNTRKNISNPRKQNENLSRSKKFLKNISAQGFKYPK